jgi:hypothetical protein
MERHRSGKGGGAAHDSKTKGVGEHVERQSAVFGCVELREIRRDHGWWRPSFA